MNKRLAFPTGYGILIIVTPTTISFSNPAEEIDHLKTCIQDLNALVESLQGIIRKQQHQMDGLIKRLYGKSSEKLDPNQLLLQELILEADKNSAPKTEEPVIPVIETKVAAHTRRHHGRQILPEHLKRVEYVLDIPALEKSCGCGKDRVRIGDDVSERLEYQPSSLHVNCYVRPKYACADSQCEGCGVKQHPTPEGPIERCEADCGLLAHVIEEKYEHHNPLFRQEVRFGRQGVEISRQTMADWMAGCAIALKPLYDLMLQKMLSYDIVLNDDTPVDMRDGPSPGIQTARMWATVGGEKFKYTLYNFTTHRRQEGPLEFFKDYRGYFMSDAYPGYDKLFLPSLPDPGSAVDGAGGGNAAAAVETATKSLITRAACWAHARRYFVDAQKSAPRAAGEILVLIAKLYHVETQAKYLAPERRLAMRWDQSAPTLNKIEKELQKHLLIHLPSSPMREGINYALKRWPELKIYLQDGRLPIDNNLAENAIRPIKLGAKNWLFLGSENGGRTAAILMTFTATCRKNKINTWAYLRDVLKRIQSHPARRLCELLPDQWQQLQMTADEPLKKIPSS